MVERASLNSCIPSDYIGFVQNPKLWKLIDETEYLLFADNIKKFN